MDSIDDTEGVNLIRFGDGIALEDLILGQASGYLTIRYTETDMVYIKGGYWVLIPGTSSPMGPCSAMGSLCSGRLHSLLLELPRTM